MASLILSMMGWNPMSESDLEIADNTKLIMVISHTTKLDFLLFMLYRSANKRLRDNLYVVVKPQLFSSWGWFLRPLGCIPATRLEEGGKGFVTNTIEEYKDKKMKIAVSPEGKTDKSIWRSGYYFLRKGLAADIVVSGVDYEKKCVHFGKVYQHDDINDLNLEEMNDLLKRDMGEIVPLYPEASEAKITRKYDPSKIGLIDWTWFILILIILILVIIVIWMIYRRIFKSGNRF